MQGLEVLNVIRVTARIKAIDDARNLPAGLMWTSRIPDNNDVLDGDIMARYQGRHQIADLIADDAKAVTYKIGKFQLETNTAPNIKLGVQLSQEELKTLIRLGNGTPANIVGMDGSSLVSSIVNSLNIGLAWRCEALRYGMLLDGFSYDRLGIKMTNVSWGLPSDLKVTPGVPWTTAASATPVSDILTIKEVASVRYGLDLSRLTMSRQAFRLMIATTEFQAKVKLLISSPYDIATNFSPSDYGRMLPLAESITGCTIEFNDTRYWTTDSTGARTSARFHPLEKVILTDPSMDGRMEAWDFANGLVTESMFLGMQNSAVIGTLDGLHRGPISYASYPPELNPPSVTLWGVKVGFPRRIQLASSAYLSVGTLTDSIAVTDPF